MAEHSVHLLHAGWRSRFPLVEKLASARVDVVLFSGAIALVAVHAAVDSFIVPEPGTGADDHLLRGLATLAVLALAAAAYPRLRAGGRAALSAFFCLLALEGAGLAIADARAVGARGEDWTGFLLLPLGLALIGSAAILLWRSRKPGRPCYLRRAGIAAVAVLAVYWLVIPVAIGILATHRPRVDVAAADLGRPYEDVTIRTSDGLNLAAWYLPSRNGAAILSYQLAKGSCRRRGCWPCTATAFSSSMRGATTVARGTPTCSAGTAPRTSTPRSPGCRDGPT